MGRFCDMEPLEQAMESIESGHDEAVKALGAMRDAYQIARKYLQTEQR